MVFADGTRLEADMIVFSAGIRPRDKLARACGLDVGPRGGIAIDSECRSSDPDIYAVGECAEGQDVGRIATEKGGNLYVCGNGGMKPRHAELLAVDLSQDELVRLVDRFLMFHVRTADRLARTST